VRPLMVDLYCCQGGASAGYSAAGFDIAGVDIVPQPRYPYPFIRGDALAVLRQMIADDMTIVMPDGTRRRVHACHASCPCQAHTNAQRIQARKHPELIAPTRDLLIATGGLPYVIENVRGAPLKDPIELCGAMFGLHTYRHRLFESNVLLTVPLHPRHVQPTVKMGRPIREGDWYHAVGNFSNVPYVRADLGMPWMSRDGLRESIPPAYAEYIGRQLMQL
jgi:DNA (cytosine-5)-methyltransferase 1